VTFKKEISMQSYTVDVTVNSKDENSSNFSLDFVPRIRPLYRL
jgi:hypothetical protein